MQVRPFRLVGETHLAHLREQVREAVGQWMRDWGGAAASAVEAMPAPSARAALQAPREWRRQWSGDTGSAWCDWTPDVVDEVKALVFPPDAVDGGDAGLDALAREGAAHAFDDLLACLQRLCAGDGAAASLLRPLDEHLCRQGSGAVCVSIAVGRATLRLAIDGDQARRMIGVAVGPALPRLAPIPLKQAIDGTPVALSVCAGHVELGAGTLLTVGVGDVIALPLALDAPMAVRFAGQDICKGFIGRQGDRLAIEVSRK